MTTTAHPRQRQPRTSRTRLGRRRLHRGDVIGRRFEPARLRRTQVADLPDGTP
ncbi:hypothetical protein [Streptomyces chartreusis]|uniref:hypothetical protein n=1 Tax=Streptomyces chartreusis TaxID=1969 RepID=UPI002E17ADBB